MNCAFRVSILYICALAPALALALAGDWPQFRGPDGSGVSDETGLPATWSPTQNLRWKAELPGRGLSCPVIAGGKVFVTASSGASLDRLHVLAFDSKTGNRLWERQLWATGNTMCHPKTTMAAATPVTDGRFVYALFGTGDLACLMADGDLVWYRAIVSDYPTVGNNLGLAASPILFQDVLILPMESVGESFVAGIDTRTGRNRWKVQRASGLNWVTPHLFRQGDRVDLIVQSAGEITGYDPETGVKRWQHAGSSGFASYPSPIAGKDLILVPGGDFLALRLQNGAPAPQVAWTSKRINMYCSSPLYHQDRIYAVNSAGVLNCADALNGKPLWQQRVKGPFSASPVLGDGKVYLVNEEGETAVVQIGDQPKLLATNPLKDTILATPAISGSAIFLRSDKFLYCVANGK